MDSVKLIARNSGDVLRKLFGKMERDAKVSAASVIGWTIRLRMSKKRAETRTIKVKQTIEKRMSRTIKQNG
jgi:hypothetical protein